MDERTMRLAERLSGEPRRAWSGAPAASIAAWLTDCEALGHELHYSVGADDQLWGLDREAIRAEITRRAKRRGRRAGAKAVKAKYGPELARIITGHTIQ